MIVGAVLGTCEVFHEVPDRRARLRKEQPVEIEDLENRPVQLSHLLPPGLEGVAFLRRTRSGRCAVDSPGELLVRQRLPLGDAMELGQVPKTSQIDEHAVGPYRRHTGPRLIEFDEIAVEERVVYDHSALVGQGRDRLPIQGLRFRRKWEPIVPPANADQPKALALQRGVVQ